MWNEEVESHKEYGWFIKGASETIENEAREQKWEFCVMGNLLAGKGVIRAREGRIRGGQGF